MKYCNDLSDHQLNNKMNDEWYRQAKAVSSESDKFTVYKSKHEILTPNHYVYSLSWNNKPQLKANYTSM